MHLIVTPHCLHKIFSHLFYPIIDFSLESLFILPAPLGPLKHLLSFELYGLPLQIHHSLLKQFLLFFSFQFFFLFLLFCSLNSFNFFFFFFTVWAFVFAYFVLFLESMLSHRRNVEKMRRIGVASVHYLLGKKSPYNRQQLLIMTL